jgi:ribosomal protein S18 acetylase RimI-like enzyme
MQVLVLPQYQRRGLGSRLLRAIYADCAADPAMLEVAVEGAASDRLRR